MYDRILYVVDKCYTQKQLNYVYIIYNTCIYIYILFRIMEGHLTGVDIVLSLGKKVLLLNVCLRGCASQS